MPMLKGDSMTIVAVISTPEKNGNTEAVVNKIAESAKANGQDVKTFYLNPMTNRKGCQACFGCKAKGRCVQNDDLTPVLDAIREAEMQTLFQQTDDERTELLERAIDHLTAEEQTLVTLFYYDDLPLADIGYITGQAPGTVATRLHRIRHKLYQLIKQIQDL